MPIPTYATNARRNTHAQRTIRARTLGTRCRDISWSTHARVHPRTLGTRCHNNTRRNAQNHARHVRTSCHYLRPARGAASATRTVNPAQSNYNDTRQHAIHRIQQSDQPCSRAQRCTWASPHSAPHMSPSCFSPFMHYCCLHKITRPQKRTINNTKHLSAAKRPSQASSLSCCPSVFPKNRAIFHETSSAATLANTRTKTTRTSKSLVISC